MDDDDSGTSEEYEIVTPKMMEQPQLNIANNGDINDLRMSLQDVLIEDQVECHKSQLESTQETVKAVGQSVFYSNLSCNEEDKIEKEMTQSMIDTDQECTLFSGVTYLGSAAINAPKSEKEIQRNMTILNEQSGDNGIKVSVSIPCSSDGTVVLYDSSSAVIAEYEIHRILYYAKGNAESNEAPCFAFTWSHGETQESAVFQCHVFRCDIPEAVGQVSSCFAKAFQRIPKQTANSMTSSVRTSLYDKEIFTFQVTMGIKEDDGHGSFSFAPRDSTQFILRENVEKQICLTVDQISEHGKELEVERCFGVLLTPGRYHKDSDLQLLEMHASKGSETGENSSYIIYGHWDPLEPAFEDLNSSNFQTYLTVAVDLVIKGIQEPVRFVIETLVRKFKKTDHIWYFNRKTMTQNFLLHLKEVPSNDLSVIHYEVISLESVPLPDKTFQLSLSSLISSTSILDLDTLTPSNEELSDGDEPLLSGTGEVSKDCTEVELESWADVLTKWTATKQQRPKQLAGLVRNGIPEALRGEVWQRLAGCENSNMMETYRVLITRDSRCEAVIQRDINRTFPAHNFFKEAGGLGQDSLYRISKAYAVYDTEVGYCQGLSFLAATLLLHMPEEQAFCVLVSLMYDYGLRDLYKDGFEDLYLRLYQLTKLMEEQLPKLWQNFQDKGIECHMFAAQWFLTVFTARFPLYFVFHILDVFLLQGIETLFQVALALLMMCKKDLLSLDFEGTLKYFRVSLPKRCRSEEVAKHIMKLATSLKLKKLKKFEQEFLQLKDNQDSEKNYIKQIEWLKLNLVRLEEEKKELEEEAMQVKEMLKREIQRAESESSRNKAIITDYKQICQRLDDEKVSAKVALNDLRSQISSCKDCRHLLGETVDQPANNRAMNNGTDPLTLRTQERIHELELELAQTKLARVEAECLNQDLLHKLHAAIAEAQMSKSTWPPWLQKTLSSIKEVAKKDGKEPCNKKEGPVPSPKRRDSAPAFPPDSHSRDTFH